jgi:hypothetical protein
LLSSTRPLSTPQITAVELNPREMGDGLPRCWLGCCPAGLPAVELVPVELVPRASTTRLG